MTDLPSLSRTRFPAVAFVAIALGLGSLAGEAFDGGRDLATSFEKALGSRASFDPGRQMGAEPTPPVVGNEAFWLDFTKKLAPVESAAFATGSTNLAPGDRFELSGEGGKRVLEVVEVRALEAASAAEVSGTGGKAQLLVSLRVVGSVQASVVRMVVDAGAPLAGLRPLARSHDRVL
ncbi:MAG: hypothetical protein JNM89_11480 [Hyphomicrobiaceae bacterium]|nr:hypothetical protein [Hyphomicrobiaceae bacterium]